MKDTLIAIAAGACFAIAGYSAAHIVPAKPTADIIVVVGTGCMGESDIAVGLEEDMIPFCKSIEAHVVNQKELPLYE